MRKLLWFATAVVFLLVGVAMVVGQSLRAKNMDQQKWAHSLSLTSNAVPQQPDWQIHSNWCANVDDGSSHKVYLATCDNGSHDQYDSVLACLHDAAKNNGDGGAAVRAIQGAGRPAVNAYMADKSPVSCKKQR